MELQGRSALITGAARGIGAACARRFAAEGARVLVTDRRDDEGQALVDALNTRHGDVARYCSLDVADEAGWAAAVAAAEAAFGALHLLVNNAGIIRNIPFEQLDADTFRKVVEVNLTGTFLGMKAAVPAMKRAGGGAIVNFSSVQGMEGREGLMAYSASKFGIRALTKTAAIELGAHGIRVNAVLPGPTRTPMTARPHWTDADYDAAYGNYPLGRMASADEIAEMVLFLASDRASFCTGGDYAVDGGMLAGKPRGIMPANPR
ncbi:MAG TPA: SDR family NAD(P)-dependent oxidoreductase [Rhodocyclaceae bacterium]|nr:SDR family NAD(P)-dependent oxidoreductase [Rhodocyclaceae bacterium]